MFGENGFEMTKWRSEMVTSYRSYLTKLDPSSEEHKLISEGIATLEKIPL
ncbi:MAG: hypothetical protein ACRCUT_10310 [Spirochaetota bacterium]